MRDSSRTVIRETAVFWDKARIPMRLEKHAIAKLEQLHQKWMSLKKNASRNTKTQRNNEAEFVDQLDDLFDISHMTPWR